MSRVHKNIMLRVISRRLSAGEGLEEIFADYPGLSDRNREELRNELADDRQEQSENK